MAKDQKKPIFFRNGITGFLDEFIIHRYHLTFEDIADTIFRGIPKGFCFNFSDNIFISKDFHIIDELANYLESTKRYKNCLEFLDLRYCNFSIEEIELLKHKLGSCNLLIQEKTLRTCIDAQSGVWYT